MTSAYHEPPSAPNVTWIAASLVVIAFHVAMAACFMRKPAPEPQGAVADAVLVELTPPKLPPAASALQAPPPTPPSPLPPAPEPPEAKQDPAPVSPPDTPPETASPEAPPEAQRDPVPPPPAADPPAMPVTPTLPTPPPITQALIAPVAPNPAIEAIRDAEVKQLQAETRAKEAAEKRRVAEARATHQRQIEDKRRADQASRDVARRDATRREEARAKAADAKAAREHSLRQSQAQAASPAAIGAWQGQVRARIFANVTRGEPGSANVVFTVTGGGGIVGASVSGASQASASALSAVRRTGSVEAPPDHKAHSLSIRINVQ